MMPTTFAATVEFGAPRNAAGAATAIRKRPLPSQIA